MGEDLGGRVVHVQFGKQAGDKPHVHGEVLCHACGHKWIGVAPEGAQPPFECLQCHSIKGMFTKFFQNVSHPTWHCSVCNGFLVSIYNHSGTPVVLCATCGETRNAIDLWNGV